MFPPAGTFPNVEMPASLPLPSRQASSQAPGTERTLAILELLGQHRLGLNLSEIARELALPVNTVSRIATALLQHGYLQRREDNKRFVLTHKLFDLARPHVREKSLVLCALDSLKWLRDTTGETTQLLAPVNHKVTILEQCISTQPIKVSSTIGLQAPMYSCAPGKAILAALPEAELETFFASVTLKQYTPSTLANRGALEADLAKTRQRGFAMDLAEGLEGIHCVAAPILDDYAFPVAAITVMAPAFRLKRDRFTELGHACAQAAQTITRRLLA
jgi:DNA-binding IclR family transcriptional regulator